jgi:hypothetical protein
MSEPCRRCGAWAVISICDSCIAENELIDLKELISELREEIERLKALLVDRGHIK